MAKSKFEYVKNFELDDRLLPNCWIVIRLDGRGFTKFTNDHQFEKPNDVRGIKLMNRCAEELMHEMKDLVFAFGESDEYSFVLNRGTELFTRRASKLVSVFASYFTSNYVFHWSNYFPDKKLLRPPTFDGRAICYPTTENLRDYLSWRQADTHINNLYNTCFWNLVQKGGLSQEDAEKTLRVSRITICLRNLMPPFVLSVHENFSKAKKNQILLFKKKKQKKIKKRERIRTKRTNYCSADSTSTTTTNPKFIAKAQLYSENHLR